MTVRWFHEEARGGVVSYRLGRDGDVLVADWLGLASYRSDRTPRFRPVEGADPRRVSKIESGAARALDRALEHRWSLHGAAVGFGDRGVLLLGESGAGKSTIAAACVADGAELFADDVAFVDDIEGALHLVPGERLHWLDPSDAPVAGVNDASAGTSNDRGKTPFAPRSLAQRPVALRTVCHVLVDPAVAEPALETLHGVDVMRAISPAIFLPPSESVEALAEHFAMVSRIATETRVVRLRRPPRVSPRIVATLLRHAKVVEDG